MYAGRAFSEDSIGASSLPFGGASLAELLSGVAVFLLEENFLNSFGVGIGFGGKRGDGKTAKSKAFQIYAGEIARQLTGWQSYTVRDSATKPTY